MAQDILTEAKDSLEGVQIFVPQSLPRREELGAELPFDDAVTPAQRIVVLAGGLGGPAAVAIGIAALAKSYFGASTLIACFAREKRAS